MRIFDCVLLGGETDLDLLEIRMAELEGIPGVVHVICEAPAGYKREPKPRHFRLQRHEDRFTRWHGRWNHVEVEPGELPAGPNADPKVRKDALREYLWHGVTAEPGDLVMHGGIDEIPAPWVVRELLEGKIPVPVCLEMRWAACTPDLVHPFPWRGTAVREWSRTGSFAGMRETRHSLPAILGAGTRLSMRGQDPGDPPRHPDGHALWRVTPDETWPRLAREAGSPA